ncbi:MAG: ATP-binding cassette domain-containing protein [Armatimonadota bacterium]
MGNIIEVERIVKRYGGQAVLNDISFRIGEGQIFALLGPNGAGKTTLLRILTGIILPDEGAVRILGAESMSTVRHKVGYLPEERGLYRRQPVGEILAYIGELKGLTASEARQRTKTVLEQVGMGAHIDSKPESLSKGMAQRIQIASALIHDPPFLILDEPFSGLDPASSRFLQEIVLDEKRRGRTILLSTHQMDTVERLCDNLLMLHRGNAVLSGTVAEVRGRFSEGVLRIEHESERIAAVPAGVVVRDASLPYVTELVPEPGRSTSHVLSALLASGTPIRAVTPMTPSLEEIFVRIVSEKG